MYKCETIHSQNKHWCYRVFEPWIYKRHSFFCTCFFLCFAFFKQKKHHEQQQAFSPPKLLPEWTSQAIHEKHRAGLDVILSQWSLRYRDGKGFDGSVGRRLWKARASGKRAKGPLGEFVKLPRLIHERVMVVSCHIFVLWIFLDSGKIKVCILCFVNDFLEITVCSSWVFSKFCIYKEYITYSFFTCEEKIIGTKIHWSIG